MAISMPACAVPAVGVASRTGTDGTNADAAHAFHASNGAVGAAVIDGIGHSEQPRTADAPPGQWSQAVTRMWGRYESGGIRRLHEGTEPLHAAKPKGADGASAAGTPSAGP